MIWIEKFDSDKGKLLFFEVLLLIFILSFFSSLIFINFLIFELAMKKLFKFSFDKNVNFFISITCSLNIKLLVD